MLTAPAFQVDFDVQERELKSLRKPIEDAPTPDWIIAAIEAMNESFPTTSTSVTAPAPTTRLFRASTAPASTTPRARSPARTRNDLAKSLKEVCASLWNFRAFSEREFYRIGHLSAAMRILVHPSYQDELVNGVAASFSPDDPLDDATFYVNSQDEEILVTNPLPTRSPRRSSCMRAARSA